MLMAVRSIVGSRYSPRPTGSVPTGGPSSPASRASPAAACAGNHHVRDRTLGEDASRIRRKPGIVARLRSFALNILRAKGVGNVSEALYTNAPSLDRLLIYGLPKSQN